MNDLHVSGAAPVLAVVGGAGAMGSLFAELLLPNLEFCLLIDRFATGDQSAEGRSVALAPLVERLTSALTRQGLEVRLLSGQQQPDEDASPLAGRDVRTAPAWLLARVRGGQEPWPDAAELSGDLALVASKLRHRAELCTVIGLRTPADATAAASLCDVLLVATHFEDAEQFDRTLAPYASGLRAGSLVADLLSIKEAPVRALCRLFETHIGVLGMHPLFGRTPADVTGLVVAVVPPSDGRPVVAWQRRLLSQLTNLGMLITPTSAAEHDAAMGYVQALTHFALLCFAYTFVRANQDPTLLLPFRTPVFEPLLYLAARVASLAHHSPEVYRAIQAECTRPELRRLFVETAQELLAAMEADGEGRMRSGNDQVSSNRRNVAASPHLSDLFETLGAPWTPAYHRDAEAFEQMVAMSSALTEPINGLRHALLRSAGQVRAIRNARTGLVTLGAVYVDPLHHDLVDLASRLRYRRFNLTTGTLEGADQVDTSAGPDVERRRIEAGLGSLPLAQVQLLSEAEMLAWLNENAGPRSGPDDLRGAEQTIGPPASPGPRRRYVGKAHFDLSLALPEWFNDECVARLLVGRTSGRAGIAVAQLAPQDSTGMLVAPGQRAAIIRLAILLPPEEVLALRAAADKQTLQATGAPRRSEQRREADRRFAAAVIERHAEARQATLDWLLAHGCALLRRQ